MYSWPGIPASVMSPIGVLPNHSPFLRPSASSTQRTIRGMKRPNRKGVYETSRGVGVKTSGCVTVTPREGRAVDVHRTVEGASAGEQPATIRSRKGTAYARGRLV